MSRDQARAVVLAAEASGVEVFLANGQLRYRPKDLAIPLLVQELSRLKSDITAYLSEGNICHRCGRPRSIHSGGVGVHPSMAAAVAYICPVFEVESDNLVQLGVAS